MDISTLLFCIGVEYFLVVLAILFKHGVLMGVMGFTVGLLGLGGLATDQSLTIWTTTGSLTLTGSALYPWAVGSLILVMVGPILVRAKRRR